MKLTIKGDTKEIAALVLAIQERRDQTNVSDFESRIGGLPKMEVPNEKHSTPEGGFVNYSVYTHDSK